MGANGSLSGENSLDDTDKFAVKSLTENKTDLAGAQRWVLTLRGTAPFNLVVLPPTRSRKRCTRSLSYKPICYKTPLARWLAWRRDCTLCVTILLPTISYSATLIHVSLVSDTHLCAGDPLPWTPQKIRTDDTWGPVCETQINITHYSTQNEPITSWSKNHCTNCNQSSPSLSNLIFNNTLYCV